MKLTEFFTAKQEPFEILVNAILETEEPHNMPSASRMIKLRQQNAGLDTTITKIILRWISETRRVCRVANDRIKPTQITDYLEAFAVKYGLIFNPSQFLATWVVGHEQVTK